MPAPSSTREIKTQQAIKERRSISPKPRSTGEQRRWMSRPERHACECPHSIRRTAINPAVTPDDVDEMLIQHILTEEIFISIFSDPQTL